MKLSLSLHPLKSTEKDEEKIFDSSVIHAIFRRYCRGAISRAEKERLEAKLAKVLEDKENAKNSLTGKYADVAFAFNRHISKKQRKFAKTVERGAKRQEKQIKKKLKKLNKRIEEIKKEEIAN